MADWTKAPQIVKSCTCDHAYQDKQYGKGMRVHNPIRVGTKDLGYRCTVCGQPINHKKPWNMVRGKLVLSPTYLASTRG